jgi:hypothetical protein
MSNGPKSRAASSLRISLNSLLVPCGLVAVRVLISPERLDRMDTRDVENGLQGLQ